MTSTKTHGGQPERRKPILPDGVLPKDPTPLEAHADFWRLVNEQFKTMGDSKERTFVIVGEILPEANEDGEVPDGAKSYNEGIGFVRANTRAVAQHVAHAYFVSGPGSRVFAMTAEELAEQDMHYALFQAKLRTKRNGLGIIDARKLTAQVMEIVTLGEMEPGPVPGTDRFPTSCVGQLFYKKNPNIPTNKARGEAADNDDEDGGNSPVKPEKNPPAAPANGGPNTRSKNRPSAFPRR